MSNDVEMKVLSTEQCDEFFKQGFIIIDGIKFTEGSVYLRSEDVEKIKRKEGDLMKIIKLLKDRINHFECQKQQLTTDHKDLLAKLNLTCTYIDDCQQEINEMQAAVEKLEKNS